VPQIPADSGKTRPGQKLEKSDKPAPKDEQVSKS